MKEKLFKFILVLGFFCICSFLFAIESNAANLLGIEWATGKLVSFNPDSGAITQDHNVQIGRGENFTGLAYNPNNKMLYALSQVQNNLYSINTDTLEVRLIGQLNIGGKRNWSDANALAFNPINNSLYTVTQTRDVGGKNDQGVLAKINLDNAQLTPIGNVPGLIKSLSCDPHDGMLYGLRLDGWGSWDSPYKTEVISINPNTAAVSTLFKTPYHTIMGLAKKPGEDTYYSWVNWTSHFYAKIDLDTKTVTSLGQSKTGVISAIVFQNFHVAKAIRRKMY